MRLLCLRNVVRVIQNPNIFPCLFLDQILHSFGKRTGIPDRRALLDTGGERNGISTQFNQFAGAQNRLFAWAAAAVDKTDDLDVVLSLEGTGMLPDRLKIRDARALILRLHTANNSNFHHDTSSLFCFDIE